MTASVTYYECNGSTHFSASGYGQLRKFVIRIIVINCFAYSGVIFVLLDHEERHKSALNLGQPAKQKLPIANGGKKKIKRMARRFLWNKTSVRDWYTTYGKSTIAAAGEFELIFTQIPRFTKSFVSRNPIKISKSVKTNHHRLHFCLANTTDVLFMSPENDFITSCLFYQT